MRRLERGERYPVAGGLTAVRRADPEMKDLAEALRSALRDEYTGASEQQMQDALANVMEALTPAEAFDFGAALNRIAKSASQVLSDPTVQSVAGAALPMAGKVIGGIYGGPAGAALGGNLGNLAAGALAGATAPRPGARPAARPPAAAPVPAPPAAAPQPVSASPPPVAGGSTAAAQALVLTQQPDVLRSLLATALGQFGRKDISGMRPAEVLAQASRLFGEAAADADQLMYMEQEADAAEGVPSTPGPPGALYADLLGADNLELAEAAEWGDF